MNKSKRYTFYKNAKHICINKYIENSFYSTMTVAKYQIQKSYGRLNVGTDKSVHRRRRCYCHAIYPRYLWDRLLDRDRRIEHPWSTIIAFSLQDIRRSSRRLGASLHIEKTITRNTGQTSDDGRSKSWYETSGVDCEIEQGKKSSSVIFLKERWRPKCNNFKNACY